MIEPGGVLQNSGAAEPLPRILLLIGHLEGGGAERQCYLLARGLRAAGFPVAVVSRPSSRRILKKYHALGITCMPVQERPCRSAVAHILWQLIGIWGMAIDLYRTFRQFRPTIVQAYLPLPNCAATIIGRLAGVPLVVCSHRYAGSANWKYDLRQAAEAVFCRMADGNVANSEGVAAHIRKRLLLPKWTIRTIYNGIEANDAGQCAQLRRLVRSELGIGTHDITVVKLANIWSHKGFQDLVRALSIAARNNPKLRAFFIGGDRGYRSTLEALIRDCGLTDKVTFLGERRDICRLLPAFDMCISASYGEGMSNAIMEAMQHGLPVIGSRVAGTGELLADGSVGLMFDPGDVEDLARHILTLAADESLRSELGRLAEQRIRERFTDSDMVRATLDFYTTLARRKSLDQEARAFELGRDVLIGREVLSLSN